MSDEEEHESRCGESFPMCALNPQRSCDLDAMLLLSCPRSCLRHQGVSHDRSLVLTRYLGCVYPGSVAEHAEVFVSTGTESLQSIREIMNHVNKLKCILTVGTIIACISPLMAQQKRLSPHETISKVIDGNRITIIYGRPYTKDPKTGETRKIWGGLVPYGQVWRTGADEATLLITQKPIVIGETTIPAGAYTLRTLPNEDGTAKLIINKQIGQWGIGPGSYDKDQDLARIDLKKEALDAPVDQFTMAISENPSGGGILKMMWENTAFSTPFTVQK